MKQEGTVQSYRVDTQDTGRRQQKQHIAFINVLSLLKIFLDIDAL